MDLSRELNSKWTGTISALRQWKANNSQFISLSAGLRTFFETNQSLQCSKSKIGIWKTREDMRQNVKIHVCNLHSPVCVLIIDDQQDLGLAYDRFRWLTASCWGPLGSCRGRLGMCSGSDVLGHLGALHHAGEGAEEAPCAWSRGWSRARSRAGGRARAWALGRNRDARGLPPLCGRGGRRGGGWTWRGRPLQIHHVAVGEIGHEAAVWQAPAEVVHGVGLVGQSGQRRWGGQMPEILQGRQRKGEQTCSQPDLQCLF